MNRNTNNHFRSIPDIDIKRSKFKRPFTHKTTLNTGDLIPFYVDEILPGDTAQIDMGAAIRMSTPIYPVMDNAYVDIYFFFTPSRILWEHFEEFMGENKLTAWEQPVEYEIPQIKPPEGGWTKGTIADYMGIPTKVDNISVSHLPFRRYCMIWNEWFRDQNVKDAAMVNLDDATVTGTNEGDYVNNAQLGAKPLKAARFHSYFTSSLPNAQKGPEILLPLGSWAPVQTRIEYLAEPSGMRLAWRGIDGSAPIEGSTKGTYITIQDDNNSDAKGTYIHSTITGSYTKAIEPVNLWTDLSQAAGATINELRQAFAIQRLYERDARGGTRFREIMRAHFGVTSPDSRFQIPEYLGGARHRINVDQVLQTSGTTETSPQGNTAAYSLTNFSDSVFTKSFTEPGYIIGVCCIRTDETYQQGIERFWSRKSRFDFYWPALANIGEQPVYNKEIYAQGTDEDDEVFGYQEAWADYRYKPSRVSGAFRSNYEYTLDSWHYANYFTEMPTLSSDFIDTTRANVNRTIAVQDELEDQFIADFYVAAEYTRPMPLYSVPGLLDHN